MKKVQILNIVLLCMSVILVVVGAILFWKIYQSAQEETKIKEMIALTQQQKSEQEQTIAMLEDGVADLKFQHEKNILNITDEELLIVMEGVDSINEKNRELLKECEDLETQITEDETKLEELKKKAEQRRKELEAKKASEEASRKASEEAARRESEEAARRESEEAARRESEEAARRESEEAARKEQEMASYYDLNRYPNKNDSKVVYLTFDDGPSYQTPQILDILDRYQVKATFFVKYSNFKDFVPYYKEIVNRGHSIGVHTASHDYEYIYGNIQNFMSDFEIIHNWILQQTGVSTTLYRFPGGSVNSYNNAIRTDIKYYLMQKNMMYYDWNVDSGDATANGTKEEIYNRVISGVGEMNHPIVLLHDTKQATVEALPSIIEQLKKMGYSFDKITSDVKPVWQR